MSRSLARGKIDISSCPPARLLAESWSFSALIEDFGLRRSSLCSTTPNPYSSGKPAERGIKIFWWLSLAEAESFMTRPATFMCVKRRSPLLWGEKKPRNVPTSFFLHPRRCLSPWYAWHRGAARRAAATNILTFDINLSRRQLHQLITASVARNRPLWGRFAFTPDLEPRSGHVSELIKDGRWKLVSSPHTN